MPPNTTSTSGLPAEPAWNPTRRNISFISAASPSPMRLRSKSTISATMSTAGGALADARTSTSMCRAWASLGLKMFGTPGSPHDVIAGRHPSRAVTCPPAAPWSICASPAASLAMSVRVLSVCTGFSSAERTAAGTPGTPIASSSGCRSPASATAALLTESGFAGSPSTASMSASRWAFRVPTRASSSSLACCATACAPAVGRLVHLGREPRLRVVERLPSGAAPR